jgi:hypothetical protein
MADIKPTKLTRYGLEVGDIELTFDPKGEYIHVEELGKWMSENFFYGDHRKLLIDVDQLQEAIEKGAEYD